MATDVLILGGYGTFGLRIAQSLCNQGLAVIINGRDNNKAQRAVKNISQATTNALISCACFDARTDLRHQLQKLQPKVVIHTCGPFQLQDTQIAQTIIEAGCHYIDLADGRDYVKNMQHLDSLARHHQVSVITAASTVPTLSAAVLAHLKDQHNIQTFKQVRIGITPGQKTARGLATTRAVLSYIGKPLVPWSGIKAKKYGWLNTYLQKYPNIGRRMMGNCEAADLDLLPQYFDIEQLTFSAGMESKLLHVGIWVCAWLVRLKIPVNLPSKASGLLKLSRHFDFLGTGNGGMHIEINGTNGQGQNITKTWFIEAMNFDGPDIPAVPAALMTIMILEGKTNTGVSPCIGHINLTAYLEALNGLAIKTYLI